VILHRGETGISVAQSSESLQRPNNRRLFTQQTPFYRLCPFAKAVTTLICSFPASRSAFINFGVGISGSGSVFERIKDQKFQVSRGSNRRFDNRDHGCTGYAGSDRGEIYPVLTQDHEWWPGKRR